MLALRSCGVLLVVAWCAAGFSLPTPGYVGPGWRPGPGGPENYTRNGFFYNQTNMYELNVTDDEGLHIFREVHADYCFSDTVPGEWMPWILDNEFPHPGQLQLSHYGCANLRFSTIAVAWYRLALENFALEEHPERPQLKLSSYVLVEDLSLKNQLTLMAQEMSPTIVFSMLGINPYWSLYPFNSNMNTDILHNTASSLNYPDPSQARIEKINKLRRQSFIDIGSQMQRVLDRIRFQLIQGTYLARTGHAGAFHRSAFAEVSISILKKPFADYTFGSFLYNDVTQDIHEAHNADELHLFYNYMDTLKDFAVHLDFGAAEAPVADPKSVVTPQAFHAFLEEICCVNCERNPNNYHAHEFFRCDMRVKMRGGSTSQKITAAFKALGRALKDLFTPRRARYLPFLEFEPSANMRRQGAFPRNAGILEPTVRPRPLHNDSNHFLGEHLANPANVY